ncbi:hypothetical protein PENARI_c080G05268 [Penicillium arizonense]|uniref:HAT C-terminal dimerisation domain-containing protein n=1 Tax=Penicillium arizonense TaxID=1835702 RepID=A0A1F5L1W3_PENAI|nr:hypothetical protein PENARI_c080G05268 [Penicillium arizonense]OGE46980.1 hypothetical protein PENARI_c080G05268 [Penicillium arizonense]
MSWAFFPPVPHEALENLRSEVHLVTEGSFEWSRPKINKMNSKQAFTVIESPDLQQLFKDIPGISLPFTSRNTLREPLLEDFNLQRAKLKEELATTCQTIALSLDVWTSKNHIPILGVIGHWLTEDFDYREKVLEFKELYGPPSGEYLAAAIQALLVELNLERKLLSITDNASNNERMAIQLCDNLKNSSGTNSLFRGLDSYIRCLAYIINLIVEDILLALKSGNTEEAASIYNNIDNAEHQSFEFQIIEPLAKLRIQALWIQRSLQRRQSWNDACNRMNLSNNFIEYDSKRQLETFIYYETSFLSFSPEDWIRLSHIHNVLSKFNEFTLFVSEKRPQISLVLPIYYEHHDLLHDVAERKEDFADLAENIASAVGGSIKKYIKYYTFMDASDLYYTALVLDPRVKGALLLNEFSEETAGRAILQTLRDYLHRKYPGTTEPLVLGLK